MNNRFHKNIAIITSLLLIAGTVGMSFTTVDTYAGIVKYNSQDDEDEKGLLEKGKDAAEKGKDVVSDKAKDAANKGKGIASKSRKVTLSQLKKWKAQIDKKSFKRGWDKAIDFATSDFAAMKGSEYVGKVAAEIELMRLDINMAKGSARSVAQEAGFVAEKWHTHTFNIDAAARGSSERASRPASNEFASADIETSYGEQASLKYYANASDSASQQAKSVIDRYNEYSKSTNHPKTLEQYLDDKGLSGEEKAVYEGVYQGQTRIIPADQMQEATDYINGKIDKYSNMEGKVPEARAKAYGETLENLRDRVQDPEGTQSTPATYEEMQAAAELAKEGKFDPEDFGISTSQIITPKLIIKQAAQTGGKTAAIKIALTTGPEFYAVICKAIETGEIDEKELKKLGIDGLTSGTEGFLEGSISCAILSACQAGTFGPQFVNATPDVVGALTVIAIDSIRYGYSLSKGDITPMQFGDLMAEDILVSSGALAAGAGLSMLFGGSVIVCMAGCLAGGMLASIGYSSGKQALLEIRDAGGFAAIVPTDTIKSTLLEKKEVASLKMKKVPTAIKGVYVNTLKDGVIRIGPKSSKNETMLLNALPSIPN